MSLGCVGPVRIICRPSVLDEEEMEKRTIGSFSTVSSGLDMTWISNGTRQAIPRTCQIRPQICVDNQQKVGSYHDIQADQGFLQPSRRPPG